MTIPILPFCQCSTSEKIVEIIKQIESRYGTTSPDAATRRRIARRTIPAGSDGYLDFDHPLHHAVESAYREAFCFGATLGLRIVAEGGSVSQLLDSLIWDRLFYRNAASKQKTPDNLIRQAQYRAVYQAIYEAGQCDNVSHLTRWVQAIYQWREDIDAGLVAAPFVCEVVR